MAKETKIEWCDSTVNATSGCNGCELWTSKTRSCYAGNMHEARLAPSMPRLYDADFRNVRLIPGRMKQAAGWRDMRGMRRSDKPWLNGCPRIIFVGDMGDFLSKEISDDYFINEILGAIQSPNGLRHRWCLLTKRPKRLAELSDRIGGLPSNVIAMTTITDQKTAQMRLPYLMQVQCHCRGVSAEPLLSPIDFTLRRYKNWRSDSIDWLICGGESGHNARPMNVEWALNLRRDCRAENVLFFMKQLGGRASKGGDMNLFPPELQVREFPV